MLYSITVLMIERQLLKDILKNTKKSYMARTKEGKIVNNIANRGLKKNGIAVRMGVGEYTGLSVQLLEDARPLLTERRVRRAIKYLSTNKIQECISILNMHEIVMKYGTNAIYEVLRLWLERNNLEVPEEYKSAAIGLELSEDMIRWATHKRNEPLLVSFKIVNIGRSKKGHSVVPESWQGKEFKDGYELHEAMDELEWRIGSPPVHFCCIYSMTIKEMYTWTCSSDEVILNWEPTIGIIIDYNNNKIRTLINEFKHRDEYREWLDEHNMLNYRPHITNSGEKIVIGCDIDKITNEKVLYMKTENVGVLVSRLQKCIRRGRGASKLLMETMNKLLKAPQYNLANQQFIRVSGSRQVMWRLFISIIEDVEPYIESESCISLHDIVCMSVLFQTDPDLQIGSEIVGKLIDTALLIQHHDEVGTNWNWRKGVQSEEQSINEDEDRISKCIKLALRVMPMMQADKTMLRKCLGYIKMYNPNKLDVLSREELLECSDEQTIRDTRLASYDMHCIPNIILDLQSELPKVLFPLTRMYDTQGLSSFIWMYSSRNNIRRNTKKNNSKKVQSIIKLLRMIQEEYDGGREEEKVNKKYNVEIKKQKSILKRGGNPTELESRQGFQLLFGRKIRLPKVNKQKSIQVIVAGTRNEPCKIKYETKYLIGAERYAGECRYIEYMKTGVTYTMPKPPEGYNWVWKDIKQVTISASIVKIMKNRSEEKRNEIKFYVNGIDCNPFESSKILVPTSTVVDIVIPNDIYKIVEIALYIRKTNNLINKKMRTIGEEREKKGDERIFRWKEKVKNSNETRISTEIWKGVYVKLYNNHKDVVTIGPVDRKGKKIHEAINYQYEGTIYRIFNMLYMLYPYCIKLKGKYRFELNKRVPEYKHMLEAIEDMSTKIKQVEILEETPIKIKTQLWDHQKKTSEMITEGILVRGKKGYGDASKVGAGKTLTALTVIANIMNENIERKIRRYRGVLVLLPSKNLYETWMTEIEKHVEGMEIVTQSANGSLSKEIKNNTIVITTLGRNRDHMIMESWAYVVIDECLSVQNKEALQTEAAFKQVISSQYGVLMLSATFFRSRFDKLFYMLKMLRSGLPEDKDYLDTILSECIVCNISETGRSWMTNINRIKLSTKQRKEYERIKEERGVISSEQLYGQLVKYIYDKIDYVEYFRTIIEKYKNRKMLVYAKSKEEADRISEMQGLNISRYPSVKGDHVVAAYSEAIYGVNKLVKYDTIVTRPPQPDKLPQMKGRLDRYGNKAKILYLEYILIEKTIEEALLLKMEVAKGFYKNHIMPLSEFYKIAVGY